MTSKELEMALADAEDAFQRKPTNPEVGLEHVSDAAVLQLRKACRLLDAAGFLLDRNGHFTVLSYPPLKRWDSAWTPVLADSSAGE